MKKSSHKKISMLFFYVSLMLSTHIYGYDPKNYINISTYAPGYFHNQAQRTSPFQSAFVNSSNHALNSGQQGQYGRMSHLIHDLQQEKSVSFFAGLWQKWQARQVGKEAERVAAAQAKKLVVHATSVIKNSVLGKTVPVSVALISNVDLLEVHTLQERNREHINSVGSAGDSSFHQTMQQRSRALHGSKQNIVTTEQRAIHPQTAGFLQAQNIDTVQFQQVDGVQIQHQLTKELVKVLDAIADRALHSHEIYQAKLAKYCAHLASATQQANIAGIVSQAISGTNCCHGMRYYLDGMMSTVDQQRQKFRAAMNYLQPVLEEYALILEQRGLQAAAIAQGLETIVAAGMIIAPTATTVATACMIGLSAAVMAPVCAQALMQVHRLDAACIHCDWNQLYDDFDRLAWLANSPESIGYLADIVGAAMVPAPALHAVVEQVMSLRPVITRVQQASGQTVQKLYLMGKNQLEHVYQQGVELLQLPEFVNFNMMHKKIWGWNIFELLPKSPLVRHSLGEGWNPALAVAFADGLEMSAMNAAEQAAITSLFSQSENTIASSVAEKIVTSSVSKTVSEGAQQLASQTVHSVEQAAESQVAQQVESLVSQQIPDLLALIETAEQIRSTAQLAEFGYTTNYDEVLQQELLQTIQEPMIVTDLATPITEAKVTELRELSLQIRQLQDLSKLTNHFTNLDKLLAQDILRLNRILELKPYRAHIKNFLDLHKPYFIHKGKIYFIEDIATYHIHAGDYFLKEKPKGGHSNFGGNKLDYFNPTINKEGPLGVKDVIFYNPRNIEKIKPSSIYPEVWSEFTCDVKAIEVMRSVDTKIFQSLDGKELTFLGKTSEGLDIIVHYDIANKRIKSHFADSEKF